MKRLFLFCSQQPCFKFVTAACVYRLCLVTRGLQVMDIMAQSPSIVAGSNLGKSVEFSGYMCESKNWQKLTFSLNLVLGPRWMHVSLRNKVCQNKQKSLVKVDIMHTLMVETLASLRSRGRCISEFKASLVNRMNSQTARATQGTQINPLSKNKNKQKCILKMIFMK